MYLPCLRQVEDPLWTCTDCRYSLGVPYSSLVGDRLKPVLWVDTYEDIIMPPEEGVDYDLPADIFKVSVMPPNTKRPPGRPKEIRIPSTGECPVKAKKAVPNKCGRCQGVGHNRTSCKNPLQH
ncbi:unnamed protein product [Microthlaspi erraticum]|uniref:Uncharacterized protein n=1 Tax=Microthlaspi erraticum TaxID=1685480 RepID=A0A6D2I3A7_9BRAS|nr:unnamed protein product [Microthlaspi erraticum]